MKQTLVFLTIAASLVVSTSGAEAATITLTPAATTCTTTNNSNFGAAQMLAQMMGCFGAPNEPLELLYKMDVGGASDYGTRASSYSTVFQNTPLDPQDAIITYVGGTVISCPACYLVVKDGNQSPAQYFFNLQTWNGVDTLAMNGFWPKQGAISNVAIWGRTTTSVPEPGSVFLLAIGFAAMTASRRRRLKDSSPS